MAKALFGHVGIAPDMRLVNEIRRLQLRVKELESEVESLRAAESLERSLSLTDAEPVLT